MFSAPNISGTSVSSVVPPWRASRSDMLPSSGIGRDARQAVAAAALEADDQLAGRHRLPLEAGGVGRQLIQQLHALFHFVFHILG